MDCGVTDTASLVSDISRLSQRYPNHSGPFQERNHWNSGNSSREIEELVAGHYYSSVDDEVIDAVSSVSDLSHLNSQRYPNHSGSLQGINHRNSANSTIEIEAVNECSSVASNDTKQVNLFMFFRLLSHYVVLYHCTNYLLCSSYTLLCDNDG